MNQSKGLALSQSKGFTIIELIVVIAIIAILAGVVLVSMGGYQGKAKDSAILQELHGVGVGVLADYLGVDGIAFGSTAINVCAVSGSIAEKQWADIVSDAGSGNYNCTGKDSKFCACAISLANTKNWMCVDASGMVKIITTAANNAAAKTACTTACGAASTTLECP